MSTTLQLLGNALSFLRFVAVRYFESRASQIASSLTFTSLLALVPIITVILTVIGAFPMFDELTIRFKVFLSNNLVPEVAGKVISIYMEEFAENAAQLTTLGILFLLLTSLMLIFFVEEAFNAIWRINRARPWLQRVLIYWAILTVGPLALGLSLSLGAWVDHASSQVMDHLPWHIDVLRIGPAALTVLAFTLLYLYVPNQHVPKRHALLGGLIGGSVFEISKHLFAYYISAVPTYRLVYGAFAAVPIFLIWLYWSWTVLLMGATLTAAMSYWRGQGWRNVTSPGRHFYEAMRVIRALAQAQRIGKPLSIRELRERVPIGLDELAGLLQRLERNRMVAATQSKGWILAQTLDVLTVADVYESIVLPGWATSPFSASDPLALAADTLHTRVLALMGMSVSDWLEQDAEGGLSRLRALEQELDGALAHWSRTR